MANRRDIQFTYSPHNKLTLLDCSFTVDPANANGLGISGLEKSGRVASVFMHTLVTAGDADNGQTNPNPASGYIVVTLQDNYNKLLDIETSSLVSSVSGAGLVPISGGLTEGGVYQIASLGTSTQTNWEDVGLPAQIVAAPGVSFVASTASAGTGSGQTQIAVTSGIDHIEVVGDPDLMNSVGSNTLGGGVGMQIILACYDSGSIAAPTAGTKVQLVMFMNNSAQGV